MERSMTIKFAGYCGDIHRTETPGTTTGMGGGNSGLQEQWFIFGSGAGREEPHQLHNVY